MLAALWNAQRYDRQQYELYQDHVRILDGRGVTSVQYEDIGDIQSSGLGAGFGIVVLRDAYANPLTRLVYVSDSNEIEKTVTALMEAHR